MAVATAVATVAVASGVAAAAPASSARQAAPSPVLSEERVVASSADPGRQLEQNRVYVASMGVRKLALDQRRAAARRAARRRAAARRAAEHAAARQAAKQAAQQPAAAPASAPAAPSGSPQQIAAAMLGSFGWSSGEFGCLQSLWNTESGWNPYASNPSSGAYGIPQALPGSKMASAGADWQTNPATQIRWGLGYIKQLYGSPCGAWSHEEAAGWY